MTILVTGATGHVGSELVRELTAAGADVRALRRREPGEPTPGVQTVIGDLNSTESFADALEGVEAAFLLSGYQQMPQTLQALATAGARRAVLLSSGAAPTRDLSNAIAEYHIRAEDDVRASGLDWTFLQPNSFMSNTLQWADPLRTGAAIRVPFADVPIATIDPADIAACAARALLTDDHAGRAYRLTGPEALRPGDRARILGEVLGRELTVHALTEDEARTDLLAVMPAKYVDANFAFFVDGTVDETSVTGQVEQILARPAGTFRAWAQRHRDAFG